MSEVTCQALSNDLRRENIVQELYHLAAEGNEWRSDKPLVNVIPGLANSAPA